MQIVGELQKNAVYLFIFDKIVCFFGKLDVPLQTDEKCGVCRVTSREKCIPLRERS